MNSIGVLSVITFKMISMITDKNKCLTIIILTLCMSWLFFGSFLLKVIDVVLKVSSQL